MDPGDGSTRWRLAVGSETQDEGRREGRGAKEGEVEAARREKKGSEKKGRERGRGEALQDRTGHSEREGKGEGEEREGEEKEGEEKEGEEKKGEGVLRQKKGARGSSEMAVQRSDEDVGEGAEGEEEGKGTAKEGGVQLLSLEPKRSIFFKSNN
mmetsp:Transcript_25117/g.45522  ORF Transcript_25117/g.45522 Transcript_25117/m.45522 type:complete len:154 (+) Transcript_25117:161-622(+)